MISCLVHVICKAPKSAVLIVSGNGSAPPYLSNVLHLYSPSPLSRRYSDLHVHKMGGRTLGERFFQFQYIEPESEIQNSLPPSGICLHSFFKVRTENPPLLHTDLLLFFFSFLFYQPITTCTFDVCVCDKALQAPSLIRWGAINNLLLVSLKGGLLWKFLHILSSVRVFISTFWVFSSYQS